MPVSPRQLMAAVFVVAYLAPDGRAVTKVEALTQQLVHPARCACPHSTDVPDRGGRPRASAFPSRRMRYIRGSTHSASAEYGRT
jgi:hypothetical protein